jgi:hypothetical protein
LRMNSHPPDVERAQALFEKKQERLRDGQLAMAEYQADCRAVREKTARLRALRLARDAGYGPGEGTEKPPAVPARAKKPPAVPARAKKPPAVRAKAQKRSPKRVTSSAA